MKPIEKAKELVKRFEQKLKYDYSNHCYTYNFGHCRECALIAVDEILKEVPAEILDAYKGETQFIINDNYKYWLKVKEEIQKL